MARRYRLEWNEEWNSLIRHLDLQEGFSFVLLLVPARDAALHCLDRLRLQFPGPDKPVIEIAITQPGEIEHVANRLVNPAQPFGASTVFVHAAVSEFDANYEQWRKAWYSGMARLNQFRNALQRDMKGTLILVGCPWVKPIVREAAPDLFSIRSTVLEIAPVTGMEETLRSIWDEGIAADGPDPDQALQAVSRVRGVPGRELELADLLLRAAEGLEARHEWDRAEAGIREALRLREAHGASPEDVSAALSALSVLLRRRGHLNEAREHGERALSLAEAALGAGNPSVAVLAADLGMILREQGRLSDARQLTERALRIAEATLPPDHPQS